MLLNCPHGDIPGEEPSQLYGSSLSLADLALPFTSLLLLLRFEILFLLIFHLIPSSIVSGLALLARNTLMTPPSESAVEGMVVMQ